MGAVPILITNDDGFGAEGLRVLEQSLTGLGTVWVVAPDREQSGQGHALTLNHPLRYERRAPQHFAVQGTPTDCIYLGIHRILDSRPRLVVSGINRGINMGDDLTYSGTVSAAFEGRIIESLDAASLREFLLVHLGAPGKPSEAGTAVTRAARRAGP